MVHLLLQSLPALQLVAAVLSAWGLVWMLGLLASVRVYPHLAVPAGVRVRYGGSLDVLVPWSAIAAVYHRREDLPSSVRTLQRRETESGLDLQVGVGGEVNVHLALSHPVLVPTRHGVLEATEVSFFADDPQDVVSDLRRHVEGVRAG